jgi:hypothetical protein
MGAPAPAVLVTVSSWGATLAAWTFFTAPHKNVELADIQADFFRLQCTIRAMVAGKLIQLA